MKKALLLIILSTLTFFTSQAQNSSLKIESKKVFGGYVYSQNEQSLKINQLLELMKGNDEAYQLMKSAKSNLIWGTILGGVGGGLIGFPIGTAIGGGDAKWELAGVGAALIIIAIPIAKGYNKKSKKAIDLYNAEITSTAYQFKPTFDLSIKGSGVGLIMSF